MKQHERELRRLFDSAGINHEWEPGGKHYHVRLSQGEITGKIVVAWSPAHVEAAINRATREARKLGLDLSPRRR